MGDDMEVAETRGCLQVELRFEPPASGDKTRGTIHVHIQQGRNFPIKEPYIKLYLSSNDKDLHNTKQKTKHIKMDTPVFDENFVFYLPEKMELDESNRLQFTVWNHSGKLAHNDCVGGFSFSLEEISQCDGDAAIAGWYEVLEESDGRNRHFELDESEVEASTLRRSGSLRSLGGGKIKRSLGGSIKHKLGKIPKKIGKSLSGSSSSLNEKKLKKEDSKSKVVAEPADDNEEDLENEMASRFGRTTTDLRASPKVERKSEVVATPRGSDDEDDSRTNGANEDDDEEAERRMAEEQERMKREKEAAEFEKIQKKKEEEKAKKEAEEKAKRDEKSKKDKEAEEKAKKKEAEELAKKEKKEAEEREKEKKKKEKEAKEAKEAEEKKEKERKEAEKKKSTSTFAKKVDIPNRIVIPSDDDEDVHSDDSSEMEPPPKKSTTPAPTSTNSVAAKKPLSSTTKKPLDLDGKDSSTDDVSVSGKKSATSVSRQVSGDDRNVLLEKIKALEEKVKGLEGELQDSEEENAKLREKVERVAELEDENEAFSLEVEKLTHEMQELNVQHQQSRQELEQKIRSLKDGPKSSNTQSLQALEAENARLKEQLSQHEKSGSNGFKGSTTSLNKNADPVHKLENMISDLQDENHALREHIDRLTLQLIDLDVSALERAAD